MNELENKILSKVNKHIRPRIAREAGSRDNKWGREFKNTREFIEFQTLKCDVLWYALENDINLKENEIDYLLDSSNLSFVDSIGTTALLLAIICSANNNNELNHIQYQKLIERCPQRDGRGEQECDLLMALRQYNLDFSKENWFSLIEKTEMANFNNQTFLLPNLLGRAKENPNIPIDHGILLGKLDTNILNTTTLGGEILMACAKYGYETLGIAIAKKMGVEDAINCIQAQIDVGNNYFSPASAQGKVFNNLKKMMDVINTEHIINNEIIKCAKKNSYGKI